MPFAAAGGKGKAAAPAGIAASGAAALEHVAGSGLRLVLREIPDDLRDLTVAQDFRRAQGTGAQIDGAAKFELLR